MIWIAPSEKDTDNAALEKRLWDAADQLRANSGLKSQEYSAPVLGLIFLRFAEVRFAAQRSKLEGHPLPSDGRGAGGEGAPRVSRRGSRVDEPAAYHAEGILYLPAEARFDYLLNRPEAENIGAKVNAAMRDIEKHNQRPGAVPICRQMQAELGFGCDLFRAKPARRQIRASASGTRIHRPALSRIAEVKVGVSPLPVQRPIAGILSAYDELMENSQRRIRLLEAMARALYREWFVHFRFPGHEKHPRVASSLGDIPQGWEVKRIGEVADTFRGRSYRSVDLAEEGGLPFLNLKCLDRDGGFRRSGLKRYTGEYKPSHVAKKGDIVMGVTDMTQERRIVARAALVPTLDKEFGIASMDLVRIEPKPPMPKAFLYSFLRYSSFADEVKQHANGANVLHLAPERITDFRFPVPPADLTRRFAAFVAATLEQMDTLQNKIENFRRTRALLLPRLLSGNTQISPTA